MLVVRREQAAIRRRQRTLPVTGTAIARARAIGESGKLDGSILIEAKLAGKKFIEVLVTDSGPGFPPERIESAFLPLSSHKPEGLGIGLSLCRSIVEAHGGQLWLEGSSKGASVRFTLPIAMEHG